MGEAIQIIRMADPQGEAAVGKLRDRLRAGVTTGTSTIDVAGEVRKIIADVAAAGDEALIAQTARLDEVELTGESLRVSPRQIDAAHKNAEPEFLELIRRVIVNIRQYQQSILIQSPPALTRGGRRLGVRYTPIDRLGVCVPGGRAVYPSTVLMTVVPAQVAGVAEIALVSPPRTDGDVNPMVLALAGELGVKEVYRVGGAQAVAALAMGTRSVKAVDMIAGPGNAFVTEAKRQLFGRVGIDSLAGPSEVLIIADDTAPADWVAADMLAQAEHAPGSAVLVTPSQKLADGVREAIEKLLLGPLTRKNDILDALSLYSGIVVVPDIDKCVDVANDFSPEHLQIITADDDKVLGRIRSAGAIFLGPHTPVSLGDYYAGPSHVLPTGGTARFFGALSCNDFLKASSVIRYDAQSLAADATDVIDFAAYEGLTAHGEAVRIRTGGKT